MVKKSNPLGILIALILGLCLTLAMLFSLSIVPIVYAANITVDTADDEDNNDGDCSLREAVRAANDNTIVDNCGAGTGADTIQFSLTTPTIITLTQGELFIEKGALTIEGPGVNLLSISGNNASRIFNIATNVVVTITGMSVQDGHSNADGGGLHSNGAVTLINTAFINNSSNADGGGLDVAGNLTISNTDILSNTAAGQGGGVNGYGGLTQIDNGRFQNNHAGSNAGAIYANSTIEISGTQFISNSSNVYAGAVWAAVNATIINGYFEQNVAQNRNMGAVYVRNDLAMDATSFISNTAGQRAGGLLVGRDATITGGIFSGNVAADGRAGGLDVAGDLWITGTQFINNQSTDNGGGVVHVGANGRFVNLLFARNSATGDGHALYLTNSGNVEMIHNTIVGPATPGTSAVTINGGGNVTITNSILSGYEIGLEAGEGNVNEDYNLFHANIPVTGTLNQLGHSYSGNPAFVDAANDDYHLSANSEALNTAVDAGISTDLDGDARPGGTGIDIGYDETTYTSDLSITKTAISNPSPSQPITYTLTFANAGTAMLPRLTITDQLPIEVIAPIVISSSVPITNVGSGSLYVWQVHNLDVGASGTITVSGVLSDVLPQLFTNTVTASSIATEINLGNNADFAEVTVPNVGPIAVNDVETILEDETAVFNPTLNDIDGDLLFIDSFDPPSNGTAVLSGTQQLVYTPTLDFNGTDSIDYTVSDGQSTNSATINITITAVNDAPILTEGAVVTVTMSEDGTPTPFSLGLNATDVDNGSLSWSISANPAHGTATVPAGPSLSGTVAYTPTTHYDQTDSFIVRVSDGTLSDTIDVNVTLTPVNDAPVMVNDAAVVLRMDNSGALKILQPNYPAAMNVLDNDSDIEGSVITVTHVGAANQGGTANVDGDGTLLGYTPTATFTGTETFTYTTSDSQLSETAVISMMVVDGIDGGIGGSTLNLPALGVEDTFTLTIDIPAGVAGGENIAFIANERVNPDGSAPSGYLFSGTSFRLDAYLDGQLLEDSYLLQRPLTLTLEYANAQIGGSEGSLTLFSWNGSEWLDSGIELIERDTELHQLTVTVNHAGEFALFNRQLIFLPLIMNNFSAAPDLVVKALEVTSMGSTGAVQLVIANEGNGAVTEEFWVDVYIDPNVAPTAVNQSWQTVGDQGLVWGITADALPLNPGQQLTLTLQSPYFISSLSHVEWPLTANMAVYAQVDSANTNTTYGAVHENHELTGGTYNNIFSATATASPSVSTATFQTNGSTPSPQLPQRSAIVQFWRWKPD